MNVGDFLRFKHPADLVEWALEQGWQSAADFETATGHKISDLIRRRRSCRAYRDSFGHLHVDVQPKLRFKVEAWGRGGSVEWEIAVVHDHDIALATFDAAVQAMPHVHLTLRDGARVIKESNAGGLVSATLLPASG
jgi:hypothetical protein